MALPHEDPEVDEGLACRAAGLSKVYGVRAKGVHAGHGFCGVRFFGMRVVSQMGTETLNPARLHCV